MPETSRRTWIHQQMVSQAQLAKYHMVCDQIKTLSQIKDKLRKELIEQLRRIGRVEPGWLEAWVEMRPPLTVSLLALQQVLPPVTFEQLMALLNLKDWTYLIVREA